KQLGPVLMQQADEAANPAFRRGQDATMAYFDGWWAARRGDYAAAQQQADRIGQLLAPDKNPRKVEPMHQLEGFIAPTQGKAGAAAVGWMIWTFNRLTRLRQLGDNAWADIDVQLKRRHDLIPSVVAVVKGHAGYERETLEALVAARGRAVDAASAGPAARYREEQSVAGGVRNILAVAEAYPELRAAASFAGLQRT